MKLIKTEEAVGHVLCHDITQIIKGVSKGARFFKGHIVREEDIPVLLSLGKDHLYVFEKDETMMHENDAAHILCDLCKNDHMDESDVKEGKIELRANIDGLFKVNKEKLYIVNHFGEMMIASRHGNTGVRKNDILAGTRIIPLVIEKEKMTKIQQLCGKEPIFTLLPFKHKKAVIFTTGNEVYYKRIQDTFTPVIVEKLQEYDVDIIHHEILEDNHEKLTSKILEYVSQADIILCTGGMSVDPDDKTPLAIKNSGADIVSYGSPVLPGAMFMLAYLNDKVIMGLPGCVMYAKRTIFDLVLPRVMADDKITREELATLGEGGLCLNCPSCTFPNCGFGKGW